MEKPVAALSTGEMAGEMARETAREKVRAHRERLRAQGLRPIQFWVPDVRTPEFAAEAHRQSLLVARSEQEKDDLAFVASLFDPSQWDGK